MRPSILTTALAFTRTIAVGGDLCCEHGPENAPGRAAPTSWPAARVSSCTRQWTVAVNHASRDTLTAGAAAWF